MGTLVVAESITLDGVFEAPAKIAGETFELAGWAEMYQSDEQNEYLASGISSGGALLLGRVTYEHMRTGWEQARGPVAEFMNNVTKYVVSRSLTEATWKHSHLISGSVADEVRRLKQGPGGLAVLGSGRLAATLREHDLIDEYSLLLFPLVLGKGRRFFDGGPRSPLKLVESRPFSSGVCLMRYEPDRG